MAEPTAPPAAATEAAKAPLPLDAFLEPLSIRGVDISPSGRWLAAIEKNGQGQQVVVTDRRTGARKTVAFSASDHVGFDWVSWKNDDRLMFKAWLFHVYHRGKSTKSDITAVRWGDFLEAVDPDGKNLVVMFQSNPSGVQRSGASVALIDRMEDDPTHVLVSAPNGRGQLSVWKADLSTGTAELHEIGDWNTAAWLTDSTGRVVAREQRVNHTTSFQGLHANGWVEFARSLDRDDGEMSEFEVFGPTARPGQFYVAAKALKPGPEDARTVSVYDVLARKPVASAWGPLRYDVARIVYKGRSKELAGVCYEAQRLRCDFRDQDYAASFRILGERFKGARDFSVVSATKDDRTWIVAAASPTHPTGFYVFDRDKGSVELIADSRPELKEAALGPVETWSYKTRDGADIDAYLTRPPGAAPGPLPLVVMPHGGPEARDDWRYDELAQFVATRGYLVLQPNFRGSGGYGLAFAEAGHRQWGLRMQDDLTDGVQALVKAGIADPRRICIVGASYGGYAALQAGATTDQLYRCVVAMAGVADLDAFMAWARKRYGADSDHYAFWRKIVGDPDADHDKLIKASPVSYAKAYPAPVLLIHGSFDGVVPLEQSKLMEAALRHAGKPVKLVVLDEEGHGGFKPANARTAYGAIADFLAANLAEPGDTAPAQP